MDSEYLLLFHAMAIGAVNLACYKSVRSADRTRHREPPPIPARLDPYELAYLRGGETEVTRIAINCDHYQDNLAANELFAPLVMHQIASWLWWIGSALILGLGGYLVPMAMANREPFVAVALFPAMALIGVIALAFACLNFPARISQRGRDYLRATGTRL